MNERTFGAIAGNDINAIIAAFEGGLTIIETEMALGSLRSMAAEAGFLEDRFDIGLERYSSLGRGRQLAGIKGGSGEQGRGAERSEQNLGEKLNWFDLV